MFRGVLLVDSESGLASSMSDGERFVFGSDESQKYLQLCSFQGVHAVNVQDYLGSEDGTFASYQFTTARIAC